MEQPPTGYEQQPQDYWQQRSPYLQQQEQWQREYEDQQRQNQYYEQNWQYKTSKEGFSPWSMNAKIATGSLAFLFLILVCVLFTGIGPSKESTNIGARIISTQIPTATPSVEERYGMEHFLLSQEQLREKRYEAFRQHWYALQARDFKRQVLEILET